MLVTCREMSRAEEALFSTGVSAEPYMDEAGRQCAEAIRQFRPTPGRAEIFCGKGNNGGDALVVARWLKRWGWSVEVHWCGGEKSLSPLGEKKRAEFEAEPMLDLPASRRSNRLIVVDGLLGIGASGDLRGEINAFAERINHLREAAFATCFAIDIPTGLNADTGEPYRGAVKADVTLSITAPKRGFAADRSVNFVGRLVEIPLEIPVPDGNDEIRFLFPGTLRLALRRREFDTHKGQAGRLAIVAGSRGLTGAAHLTATGASRAGAGLTTLYVPSEIYPILSSRVPAEVMVRPLPPGAAGRDEIDNFQPDVIAIGPGLGTEVDLGLVERIQSFPGAVVVDADALNALACGGIHPESLPSNRLLTPHPGELARLLPEGELIEGESRVELTRRLADRWGLTLLHKGARTAIASPHRPVELNTTGHSGMASGGMGDLLTGMAAALIAQGLGTHDAACVGSWILGRAAEQATEGGRMAEESVTASGVAEFIGLALRDLQEGCW